MQLLSRFRLCRRTPYVSQQSALCAFLAGATANAITITILYPLLLAKVRVQAGHARLGRALSMTDVWAAALKTEGWRGLYAALGVQILKGFVNQGVAMLVKQRYVFPCTLLSSGSRLLTSFNMLIGSSTL